jgi:chromosome segregation ATPase
MGWASYFEDNREATDEGRRLRASTGESGKDRASAHALKGLAEGRDQDLLSGHNQMVSIAEESRRELRREKKEHRRDKSEMESQIAMLVAERDQALSKQQGLHKHNVELHHSFKRLETELTSERNRRRTAEYELKELDRRLSSSPVEKGRMIDAYSRPADIDFHKPGERRW